MMWPPVKPNPGDKRKLDRAAGWIVIAVCAFALVVAYLGRSV